MFMYGSRILLRRACALLGVAVLVSIESANGNGPAAAAKIITAMAIPRTAPWLARP